MNNYGKNVKEYRKEKYLALLIWGILISLRFSVGIFIRYAYPLMPRAPLLFPGILWPAGYIKPHYICTPLHCEEAFSFHFLPAN